MNSKRFIKEQRKWFACSYEQFAAFGGPCLYFHDECLRAGRKSFLSDRHVEMLYATLTAWGMHRMGDATTAKTKLTEWKIFRSSLVDYAKELRHFRQYHMSDMTESNFSRAVSDLWPYYKALKLSVSQATIVVNSKAFYHLFPEFIPPIDRQYIIRFFREPPTHWRDATKRFRQINLPPGIDAQFKLFHNTCMQIKQLLDNVDRRLIERQRREHGVSAPKAIDNAIVNYVRILSRKARGRDVRAV